MLRQRLLPLTVLLVAGCTPLQWVKPDFTAEQLDQDLAQCEQQAWREASWRAWWYYRPLAPYVVQDIQGRRYLVYPYSPFNDPFGDRFFEESRLTHFCMRAKGYDLVPADKIQPSAQGTSSGKP